jgi:lipid-binding SYLF domain-containing protein
MKTHTVFSLLALVILGGLAGCQTTPKNEDARENLADEVQTAMNRFERADPDLREFLNNSAGYAMFPSVGKAGFIAGAAYGKGQAFAKGERIGYADLRQGSVGLQAGAQEFSELVVFGTQEALDKFRREKLEFGANASAVALKAGAAKAASFRDGVAVFTQARGGAMVELSISGQQLTFSPNGGDRTVETRTTTSDRPTETHTERRETTETQTR